MRRRRAGSGSVMKQRAALRLSFQTKVLVPVLGVLVLLPVVTLWIVGRHIDAQARSDAAQRLVTTRSVFAATMDFRARTLLGRYRTLANEPRFRAAAQVADVRTLNDSLDRLLIEVGEETTLALFTVVPDGRTAHARRTGGPAAEAFASAARPITEAALSGQPGIGIVQVGDRLMHAAGVPLFLPDGPLLGVLTLGADLEASALQEIKSLTRVEIALAGETGPPVADTFTMGDPAETAAVAGLLHAGEGAGVQPLHLGDRHYLALAGEYGREGPGQGMRYLLLSSYGETLAAMDRTRSLLVAITLGGILVGGTLVLVLIRRIVHPLLALRDSAEAVGRGDFSRRVPIVADDECGELADAFNRMIDNLHASRAELEKTLQTLRETQAQLVQSEKLSAVGQFVAGVAHELNNPLTTVVGYAELLGGADVEPPQKVYLERIGQAAARCRKIVQNLLSFARQHPPERKPVRLEEVADAVLEFLAYEMRHSGVRVEKAYGSDIPPLIGDTHQLQQVVLNLVNNARQALEEFRRDGCIQLITERAGDRVRIRIRDNGPGIAREHLSRIFDPFFTTKAEGKGTGLGLSLCYGIVQEHHGRIDVQSEPGHGAEFILDFPAADAAALSAAERPTTSAKPAESASPLPTGAGRAALIVDDEAWIRDVATDVLRAEGYQVEVAECGEAAAVALRRRRFDLVISDWKMPGLNGMALYERLRAEDPATARGFLFMTGDLISEGFQAFLRKHHRPCLPKPFAPRELRAAVAKLAAGG